MTTSNIKHAYLIIAHNEFEVLELLTKALDDSRNDIYVHIDAKAKIQPKLHTKQSQLYLLEEKIDVRWGDYSQIEVEILLFEYAYKKQAENSTIYSYFHLISGVDFPLKSQDYIHQFFDANQGKEFIGFFQADVDKELRRKVGVYHLFPKKFSKERQLTISNILRHLCIRCQLLLGIHRNCDLELTRGTNWVSITNDFVEFLLSKKKEIHKRFHHTFCADEVYKHTLCMNSHFKDDIYNLQNEALGCMRETNWVITEDNSFLPPFTMADYKRLKESPMLFARKFDKQNIDLVQKIYSDLIGL